MVLNLIIIASAAFIPLVIGFIWYNPKVFGNAWIKANGFSQQDIEGANMPLILGLTYLLSFIFGVAITMIVIHQNHVFSIFADNPDATKAGTELNLYLAEFMNQYGGKFRTFGHGAFHGVISSIFMVLPVIGINSLFERRGFKYIAIHVGYWTVCLALMGGVICHFS